MSANRELAWWFPLLLRRGTLLTAKPGVCEMSMPDDDQHTLKLFKVKSVDAGEMMFVASNKHGNDSCTFTVEMAGRSAEPSELLTRTHTDFHCCDCLNCLLLWLSTAAPTFETIMEDLDVCAGETPRFAVVVEGKPVPDILWFKVPDQSSWPVRSQLMKKHTYIHQFM